MPLSPQITLTATLTDYSGAEIGSSSQPAYLRVALCGYGSFLPRVPGAAMVAKVSSWPIDIPYLGAPINIQLWGNDVILPGGTYYEIAVLDASKNVVQAAAYIFAGTQTVDLSNLTPSFPPSLIPEIISGLVTVVWSLSPIYNCALIDGIITFDLTLTGSVTGGLLTGCYPGQVVIFIISQNGTGGWSFAWPANVLNAGVINSLPNSVTTQAFVARANGDLYPLGPQTWS